MGPMLDGLDVPIQHGYRILRPTRRNTMLPLLQNIQDLSLVVSTSSLVPEIYDHLTSALCHVKVLRVYFGDVTVDLDRSGYEKQPVLEILSLAPRAQHSIFSFHPDIDLAWFGGSLDDSEIDGEPYDSHLFRRQITLIVGSRRPCIPEPFRSFDTIRVVLASRAVEHDVKMVGFSLMPETASGVLPTAMEEYNSGMPDWALCSTLREACRIRHGKTTDIFLMDDLAVLNDNPMHARSLKEVYTNVMASEGVDATDIAAIRPRTRKEFLETCPGVLSPEITAWYQRLEDTPAALKMQAFRQPDDEERHVAFLLGEWNLTMYVVSSLLKLITQLAGWQRSGRLIFRSKLDYGG